MSGPTASNTKVGFTCRDCDKDDWIARSALQEDSIDGCPIEYLEMRYRRPTRCQICGILKGVDEALRNLLSRFPFLETEGMATAENMKELEVNGLVKPYRSQEERGNGEESDVMTVEERQAMCDKVVNSFVKTAGQGITEEETFAEEAAEESEGSTVDDATEEAMHALSLDLETNTLAEESEMGSEEKEAV